MLYLVQFHTPYDGSWRSMVCNSPEAARALIWDFCTAPDPFFHRVTIQTVSAGHPLRDYASYSLEMPEPRTSDEEFAATVPPSDEEFAAILDMPVGDLAHFLSFL